MIEVHQARTPELVATVSRFVAAHEATNGHYGDRDPAWLDVLEQSLGHRPIVLLSRDAESRVDGYLPLALVSSQLFGKFLVSLPYLTHVGIIADRETVARALCEEALALAERLDADHLEIRGAAPTGERACSAIRNDKIRMTRELPEDPRELWSRLGAKNRNLVRKGEKHGLELRIGRHELLATFYDILAEKMRDLGSPVYPRRFFAAILDGFGERAEIATVERGGRGVAGALLLHDLRGRAGRTASSVPAASARRSERATSANPWMYHRLLLRALERGSREFDLGRSTRDSGPYHFKRHWDGEEIPTHWQYFTRRSDPIRLRHDDPRHARRIAAWKRLPVWLTKILGPAIVRGIP